MDQDDRECARGLARNDHGGAEHAAPDRPLEPRVNRLALQSKNPEDAFVNASKRFSLDEALEAFDPQRELPKGKRSFTR